MRISSSLIGLRALEVVLGGLFFYAGLQKVLHLHEFAEAVLAYQLLPESLVGLAVAGLPWLEIAAGLCLVAGLKRRSCLLLLTGTGGCLPGRHPHHHGPGAHHRLRLRLVFSTAGGVGAVLEDAVLLIWAAGLYWWELLRSEKCGPGSIAQAAP